MVGLRGFGKKPSQRAIEQLYARVVAQARRPEFYTVCGVADTVEGRFDALILHIFLVLRRLRRVDPADQHLAQALVDHLFANLDVNLRELGVGDMGIGRRIRKMAEAFQGRVAAYGQALDENNQAGLEAALARNLFHGVAVTPAQVAAVAAYVRQGDAALAAQSSSAVAAGQVEFPAPPAPAGEAEA